MKVECDLCPNCCALADGETGRCKARQNIGGKIICKNYGHVTALALDSIEKKPLRRFFPGSQIVSVGSFGCNLHCPFCQNYEISAVDAAQGNTAKVTPDKIIEQAVQLLPYGNIGIAYTYNEPLVGYEFVRDCAELAQAHGLKNVLVTNGCFYEAPVQTLLSYIDAMNIDLKGFTDTFYQQVGGNLETVQRTIALAVQRCHVEVTSLIIPGENDSEEEMDALAAWLSSLSPEIPLHVTRFFPRYQMKDRSATPVKTVYQLAQVARRHLRYVYEGNC